MLLMGSNRFGASIVSQMKRFWHSNPSMSNVEKILSSDVVDATFSCDVLEVTFCVDVSSTSSSIVNDLRMASDGRKTVNGILMRSSKLKKMEKKRLINYRNLFIIVVFCSSKKFYRLRKTPPSILTVGGLMIEKDRERKR